MALRLAIFEDDEETVNTFQQVLRKAEAFVRLREPTEVWWSKSPYLAPTRLGGAASGAKLDASAAEGFDAVVLDLRFDDPSGLSSDEQRGADRRYGVFHGLHVYDLLHGIGRQQSLLVNSKELPSLRAKADADDVVRQSSAAFFADSQAGVFAVFQKDAAELDSLVLRIVQLADLKERDYSCSATLRERLLLVAKRADQAEHVLILGERGTGKEGAAQHIHRLGQLSLSFAGKGISRSTMRELVALNCAGLVGSVAMSELFGYVAAAFTGAATPKLGLALATILDETPSRPTSAAATAGSVGFRKWLLSQNKATMAAEGRDLVLRAGAPMGTLFLDEFAELDATMQAALLRFVEYGECRPVGFDGVVRLRVPRRPSEEPVHHVRIVAATNSGRVRRLAGLSERPDAGTDDEVGAMGMREDLVDRIGHWLVELPRLAAADVAGLITRVGRAFVRVTWAEDARQELERRAPSLPGNRRQCVTVIRRAMAIVEERITLGLGATGRAEVTKADLEAALNPIVVR